MLAVKMNASETRVSSFTNETVDVVEDGTDRPLGEFFFLISMCSVFPFALIGCITYATYFEIRSFPAVELFLSPGAYPH